MRSPIIRPSITEAGTLGAALLAGLGTGVWSSPGEAVGRFVRLTRTFEPDAARHRAYQEKFALFSSLYHQLKPLLKQLSESRNDT